MQLQIVVIGRLAIVMKMWILVKMHIFYQMNLLFLLLQIGMYGEKPIIIMNLFILITF